MMRVAVAIGAAALIAVSGVRLLRIEGESMAPAIRSGDFVLTAELPLPLLGGRGAIVLRPERSGAPPGWLLHRVIERGDGWRRTAGDASSAPDADRVLDRDVRGVMIAVLPIAPLLHLAGHVANVVGAAFTGRSAVSVAIASSNGAPITLAATSNSGVDSVGRLLPGGSVTSLFLLGWAGSATHQLRIDATAFAPLAASPTSNIRSLARSLRIATRCRDALDSNATWWAASELMSAKWSSAVTSTGRLLEVNPDTWPGGLLCETTATLLGALGAQAAALPLPLLWGPL